MRLLLDSHFAFWWQTGDRRLTRRIRTFIERADSVAVSHVTLWKLTVKAGLGRIAIDLPVFAVQVEAMGFEWLPITLEHITALSQLPQLVDHRDPFDRLLIAQSRAPLRTFVTINEVLGGYGKMVRVM